MMAATSKLQCLRTIDDKWFNQLRRLALLATRVHLDIDPHFKSAPELIGSYLAHVDSYCHEKTGYTVDISYPSDPIVSMASTKVLVQDPKLWKEGLNVLKSFIRSRSIASGERGELISQLICSYAADLITKGVPARQDSSVPSLKVRDFLSQLMGERHYEEFLSRAEKKEKNIEAVLDGYVNFNHFVKVEGYIPQRGDLVEFLHRRAAVVCKSCQVGVDMIIPVVLRNPHGKPSGQTPVSYGKDNRSSFEAQPVHKESLDSADLTHQISEIANSLELMNDVTAGPIRLSSENSASPDRSSPKRVSSESIASPKRMMPQEHKADEYLMDERFVSYILIDSKNYQSGCLLKDLRRLNPFAAGLEPESPEEAEHTVPYLAIAMYYDGKETSCIEELPTYKEGQQEPNNFASITLCNAHQNFPDVAKEFTELLRSTDGIDLASEGEDRLIKCLQKYGVKGTMLPQKSTEVDIHTVVGVNPEPSRKRAKL